MRLNEIKDNDSAKQNKKRVGRGIGSGKGKTAGKGHKGQKARAGGGVRTGFEGGAMPLYMRLPKRGFKNAPFKKEYAVVNLKEIDQKYDAGEVNRENLISNGVLKGRNKRLPIKILGVGAIAKALTFLDIEKFSKSAKGLIEKAGGQIQSSKSGK